MKHTGLKAIIWKEGKHYVAQCLNVDVSSFGANKPEALRNLKEAIQLYLEDPYAGTVLTVNSAELVETNL